MMALTKKEYCYEGINMNNPNIYDNGVTLPNKPLDGLF